MSIAIKAENISKQYRLGEISTGAISHDINRWWHKIRGKENPYLKIGEANDRTNKGNSEYVWSLRDINFEIQQGDAVGIIGRNGAGKSTLLKILSKVTQPTTGNIKTKGRIASLLEVGTGFHPELSGRDNIYLNGAILGMRKAEIKSKFDEIVDFSGVERYIDTPVKRYSSGMYVRLAFAVAAFLESEILIVDEVLAVGDAEFQKKCLGKMGEVSKGEGRTVLFVSHNMGAVKSLCQEGVLLNNGKVQELGNINNVISKYLSDSEIIAKVYYNNEKNIKNLKSYISEIKVFINNEHLSDSRIIDVYDKISFEITYILLDEIKDLCLYFSCSKSGELLFANFESSLNNFVLQKQNKGTYITMMTLPNPILKPGFYNFEFHLSKIGFGSIDIVQNEISFEVDLLSINPRFTYASKDRPGIIVVEPKWETSEKNE